MAISEEKRREASERGWMGLLRSPEMRKILPYMRHGRAAMVSSLILGLASSSFEVARVATLLVALQALAGVPHVIRSLAGWNPPTDPIILLGIVAALTVMRSFLEWNRRVLSAVAQRDFVNAIRADAMRGVFGQPLDAFTDMRAGEATFIINSQASRFSTFIPLLSDAVASVLTLGAIGWLAVKTEPRLSALMLLFAAAIWVCTRPFYWKLQEVGFRQATASTDAAARFQDAVRGIQLVKACRTEGFETERCARAANRASELQVTATIHRQTATEIASVGGVMATLLTAWLGTLRGVDGPTLFALLVLAGRMLPEVGKIREAWMSLAGMWGHLVQVAELLPTEAPRAAVVVPSTEYPEKLVGVGVQFNYGDHPVLRHVSLTVKAGEAVALVGLTGSGKSTLLDILAGLRHGQGGLVAYQGRDQQNIRPSQVQIGYGTQDPILFYGTVAENIRYGDTSELPLVGDPYSQFLEVPTDTHVGDSGSRLSGGQRQQVGIARIGWQGAPVWLLDEPTSSMDLETEAKMMEWILQQRVRQDARVKRIILVATHRLHAIKDFDRILVLHGGRITEEGTHRQLVKRDGLYARLWKLQEAAK